MKHCLKMLLENLRVSESRRRPNFVLREASLKKFPEATSTYFGCLSRKEFALIAFLHSVCHSIALSELSISQSKSERRVRANMFKAIKDARRRGVETLLEVVGSTERTVDEEFDSHEERFIKMLQDMNECGFPP